MILNNKTCKTGRNLQKINNGYFMSWTFLMNPAEEFDGETEKVDLEGGVRQSYKLAGAHNGLQ